jgi:hypothetical protein
MATSTPNFNHPYPRTVEAEAVPDGPASRLARSMVELVVGAPRVGTAERVASAGASVAEFLGRPVRRVFEPAIDARSDAAQDALISLLDLTRLMIQEAVDLVDLNVVLDRIDINSLLRRIDVNELVRRLDISDLLTRVDVDEIVRRVDINEIVRRVDIEEIIRRVDVNEVVSRVDVTEIVERVDIEAVLDRVDLNEIMEKVDIDGIVERTEIGSLVVRSTSGVATEALDAVRSRAVGIDSTMTRIVDRLRRRRGPRPVAPGLAPESPA